MVTCPACGDSSPIGTSRCSCGSALTLSAAAAKSSPDPSPPSLKGVEGWLLFLCVQLILFLPAVCLFGLYRLLTQAFNVHPALRHFRYFLFTESVLFVILAGVGIRAGWLLLKPDRRGLRWARGAIAGSFLAQIAPIGLASLFRLSAAFQDQLQPSIRNGAWRALPGPVIWFLYLEYSKRVTATYGSLENREEVGPADDKAPPVGDARQVCFLCEGPATVEEGEATICVGRSRPRGLNGRECKRNNNKGLGPRGRLSAGWCALFPCR